MPTIPPPAGSGPLRALTYGRQSRAYPCARESNRLGLDRAGRPRAGVWRRDWPTWSSRASPCRPAHARWRQRSRTDGPLNRGPLTRRVQVLPHTVRVPAAAAPEPTTRDETRAGPGRPTPSGCGRSHGLSGGRSAPGPSCPGRRSPQAWSRGHSPTASRRSCASSRGWENIGQWPVSISTSRQSSPPRSFATSSLGSGSPSVHLMYVAGR